MAFSKFFEINSDQSDNLTIYTDFKTLLEKHDFEDISINIFIDFCNNSNFDKSTTAAFALNQSMMFIQGVKGLPLEFVDGLHSLVQKNNLNNITLYEFIDQLKLEFPEIFIKKPKEKNLVNKVTRQQAEELVEMYKDPSFATMLDNFKKIYGQRQLVDFLTENGFPPESIEIIFKNVYSFKGYRNITVTDMVDLLLSIIRKRYEIEVSFIKDGYGIKMRRFKHLGYYKLVELYNLIKLSVES